jgi:hypothetical protein
MKTTLRKAYGPPGHSCCAMVIDNEFELENYTENEMQAYSTINYTLYKFIEIYFNL